MRDRDLHFVKKHVVRSKSCRRRSPLLIALITTIWDQRFVTFFDVTLSLLRFKFRVDDIKHFQFPSALFASHAGCHWEVSSTYLHEDVTETATLNGLSFMTLELR